MSDEYEGLSATFAEACRKADEEYRRKHGAVPEPEPIPLVKDNGVPSAQSLQAHYERALRERRAIAPAASTLMAAEFLWRLGDQKRWEAWLGEHSQEEIDAIIEHLERKYAARSE